MKLGSVTQQPSERLPYTVRYEDVLMEGDSVESATAVANGGLVVEDVFVGNNFVRFWVTGGRTGNVYKIEVTTTTRLGAVYQDEIIVKVKEI